jgi:hypothetical protein
MIILAQVFLKLKMEDIDLSIAFLNNKFFL